MYEKSKILQSPHNKKRRLTANKRPNDLTLMCFINKNVTMSIKYDIQEKKQETDRLSPIFLTNYYLPPGVFTTRVLLLLVLYECLRRKVKRVSFIMHELLKKNLGLIVTGWATKHLTIPCTCDAQLNQFFSPLPSLFSSLNTCLILVTGN